MARGMKTKPSVKWIAAVLLLGLVGVASSCGKPAPPVAADEPAVVADYLAITEAVADAVVAHPDDAAAAGHALEALWTEHELAWKATVARIRELYQDDLLRSSDARMPTRQPELLKKLEAASKRMTPHIKGTPHVLSDERARTVLAALAISEDYAQVVRTKWRELEGGDEK